MKWNNELLKFIFSVLALYLLGLVIYESFLLPKTKIDEYLIHSWLIRTFASVNNHLFILAILILARIMSVHKNKK